MGKLTKKYDDEGMLAIVKSEDTKAALTLEELEDYEFFVFLDKENQVV